MHFVPTPTAVRRILIFGGTFILTVAGCFEMYQVLKVGGVTTLESGVLVLFVVLFAWISLSFTSAIAGFFVLLFDKRDVLGIEPDDPLPAVHARTAMLLPTYNEDPHRVMARLRVTYRSVQATGVGSQFDWFVLSDSTDPRIWIEEERELLVLRRAGLANLYYRHRERNTARKSGNIEDWVRQFGGGYDDMIVLDADSLMTGDTIVRLVDAMERHDDVALIQTLPIIVNARSMFARMQQFAGRLYGPLIAAGCAWWHGSEGNYWGHNAIIRVKAFADHAGLPELKGRKPFGGHILSHDFIEAALMRRGGWAIHMTTKLKGSYEECPPSPIDYAARDRRWCQGNLQHLAVLPARGLHWVSRLHLLTGVGSYLTAPLWFLFLLFGMLISLQAQFVRPEYFGKEYSLFPTWPAQDPVRAAWVFVATMSLLITPKLLAYLLLLTQPKERREFGGRFRAFVGVLAETLLSGLIAPVMMVFQSAAVVQILMGRDSGWAVQRRDDGGVDGAEIRRKYFAPTAIGIVMAVSAYAVSLPLLVWMTPVIMGLLLSIPVAAMCSRTVSPGETPYVFVTPEQTAPTDVVTNANGAATSHPAGNELPFCALRSDPDLLATHLSACGKDKPRPRGLIDVHLATARAKLDDASTLPEACEFLDDTETFAVLKSEPDLRRLMALPN
jgi:membrane glycosyltransferase